MDEDHDAGVLAGDLLHLLPAPLTGGLRGAVQEFAHPVLRLLQHEQDPGGVLNGLVVDVLLTVEHDDVAGRVGLALRVEHVRQHRDAQRRQVAGGGDAGGAAVDGQRGHVGGTLPDQGVAHLLDTRAAGTGEAEYLAAVQLEGDRFGGALQAYDVHHDVGGGVGASRRDLDDGTEHRLGELVDGGGGGIEDLLDLAVAQHRDPVAQPQRLLQLVGDVEDAPALLDRPVEGVAQVLEFVGVEGVAEFVDDDDLTRVGEHADHLGHAAFRVAETAEPVGGGQGDAGLGEDSFGAGHQFREAGSPLDVPEHGLDDGQSRIQLVLGVDEHDLPWIPRPTRETGHSLIGRRVTGDDRGHGGLPNSVGADYAEHLPVSEVDVDSGQHLEPTEGLPHPPDRQQRLFIPHEYLVVVIRSQREAVSSAPGQVPGEFLSRSGRLGDPTLSDG